MGAAAAQSEDPPELDLSAGQSGRLQSDTPMAGAMFGFSMAAGKLRGSTDNEDDIVIAAPFEALPNPGGHPISGAGVAYVFENHLLLPPEGKPARLIATGLAAYGGKVNTGASLGVRAMAIGNPRGSVNGTAYDNLIFIGCYQHRSEYPGVSGSFDGGSVEIYNFNVPGSGVDQKSLFAPLEYDPEVEEWVVVPTEVRQFGHGLALGDVTGDGVDDLVVGAPGTDVETARDGKGRIYVFKGHGAIGGNGDFYAQPDLWWIGINAVEPHAALQDWGSEFGCQVAVCHFCGTDAREILVGREDRLMTASVTGFESDCSVSTPDCPDPTPIPTVQPEPKGGSAYVFRGSYIQIHLYGEPFDPQTNPESTVNTVIQPPWPDENAANGGLDEDFPEYQVLRNPFGDSPQNASYCRLPNDCYPQWDDQFGWFVYNGGDLGSDADSFSEGDLDGVDDAVVYGDSTDFIGSQCVCDPETPLAGGLWVYYGVGWAAHDMVYDDKVEEHDHKAVVLLQRPQNVGPPQEGGRFGRAFARLDAWKASSTATAEPAILISESSADWGTPEVDQAGVVYLVRLPLPAPNADPLTAVSIDNAFGSEPLTEPPSGIEEERDAAHVFGTWITVLDYKGDVETYGQQFVVSARQASVLPDVEDPELQTQAGRAFIWYRPGP